MSNIYNMQEQPVENTEVQPAQAFQFACFLLYALLNTPTDFTLIGDNPSITDMFPDFYKDGFGDGGIY